MIPVRWLCAVLALSSAGCKFAQHGDKHFTVRLCHATTGLGGADAVVVEEVLEVRETADRPDYLESLVSARVILAQSGTFETSAPRLADSSILFRNNRLEYRWTVLQPGAIVTTFYPEGIYPGLATRTDGRAMRC